MFNRYGYLLSFILPCTTLLFLLSEPREAWQAPLWTLPLWGLVLADWLSPALKRQQGAIITAKFYNGILYGLAFIHFFNIGLMLNYVSQLPWNTPNEITSGLVNLGVVRILVGTCSGSSALIVAHELIHRSQKNLKLLGRMLLFSVCYEHFDIVHQREHHRRVGKLEDITTARQGESFHCYWKRVYIGHFRCAWFSELSRLGIAKDSPFCMTMLKNRVLQGVLIELMMVCTMVIMFGWIAALIFLYQAFAGVRLIETINYFQHWGLEEGTTRKTLAWVNDSWLTHYVLIGLSNHIGHHENAARHFQNVAYSEQGPKMPYGYFVTNLWVKLNNASYRNRSLRELKNFDPSFIA